MLSRKVSSLVCPLHGSSNRAEMAIITIKGFAAVVRDLHRCEIEGATIELTCEEDRVLSVNLAQTANTLFIPPRLQQWVEHTNAQVVKLAAPTAGALVATALARRIGPV